MTGHPSGHVVTLTANPSLDRTLELPGPLERGGVVRLAGERAPSPGARASTWPGRSPPPAATSSPCCPPPTTTRSSPPCAALGLRTGDGARCAAPVRTNYTLAEPDGTTTKLNEPGAGARRRHPRRARPRAPARARRGRPLGGALRLAAARHAGRLVRRPGPRRCATPAPGSPSTPPRRRCSRCWRPARTPRPTCSSRTPRSWPSWPASRRTTCSPTRRPPWPPSARCTTAAWPRCCSPSAPTAPCCPPPTAGCGRPGRRAIAVRSTVGAGDCSLAGYLLADLAGAPAGRAAAHRRRLRSGQRRRSPDPPSPPRPRWTAPPFGSPPARPARTAAPLAAELGTTPSRPPAGTSADASEEVHHARPDHPRPRRPRRRPRRRQERGHPPAGRAGRRRRPGHRRRRPARRRLAREAQAATGPARRHRHPALPLGGGHRGLARLRPAAPDGRLRRPGRPRRPGLPHRRARPHGDADHLTLLTALARALVRPEFVASLRAAASAEEIVRLVRRRRLPRAGRGARRPPAAAAGRRRPPPPPAPAAAQHRRRQRLPDRDRAHLHGRRQAGRRRRRPPGVDVHVETQGSSGATPLDPAVIRAADAVIFAVDVGVRDQDRFAGKPVVQSGTKRAINEPDVMIREALAAADDPNARRVAGAAGGGADAAAAAGGRPGVGIGAPPLAAHRRQLHDPVRRGRRPADRARLPARRLRDRPARVQGGQQLGPTGC